jgi:peroxiredoxin Q/BCP
MAAVIERPVHLNRATVVTLNSLMAIGTPIEDVMMGVLHEERCPDMYGNQDRDSNFLLDVLHLPIQCMHPQGEMQEFSFIAFLSNICYLLEKVVTMKTIISALMFLIFGTTIQAQSLSAPAVGSIAPDFTLPYATKDSIAKVFLKLSDYVGKRAVIVAFYPADWSTGCTKEVCTMRDNFAALQSLDAEVLAISGDYVWSHHEWAKFHNLPFKLLSDHSHAVAKLYDSFNDKSLYNRRTVFVVDKKGKIAYENVAYSVADLQDFEKLKAALASLK